MNNTQNTENKKDVHTNTTKPEKKKSKAKFVIIPLVIALVICILIIIALVILGSLGVLGVGVAGIFMYNKTPEVAVVETIQETTEATVTEEAIITEPQIPEDSGDSVSVSEVTHNYTPDPYYGANEFYITYDTPAHAGVNLRETPDDNSVKIMVLPEGTTVTRLYEAGETTETKYILVRVEVDGAEYTGYVMQRYVSTFSGASFDSFVSYNTPGHAGLVLRETSSASSKHLMVIPEGTELRVTDNTTGAYWAVDVFYEGEIYSGYLLSTYIESIN